MSKFISRRRGHTMVETVVATGITLAALVGLGSTMSMAGRMEQRVRLQNDTGQAVALAMQRMNQEIREAKEVRLAAPHQFRIFYPVVGADGRYDRFRTDPGTWIEYAQTDANGTPDPTGRYLWRSTSAGPGRAIADSILTLRATASSDSVRLSLHVQKTEGQLTADAQLDQRVMFLRNF